MGLTLTLSNKVVKTIEEVTKVVLQFFDTTTMYAAINRTSNTLIHKVRILDPLRNIGPSHATTLYI